MEYTDLIFSVRVPLCLLGLADHEAKLFLAMKLYEVKKVSLGQAAEMADCSKECMMDMLERYSISPFLDYSPEELEKELCI